MLIDTNNIQYQNNCKQCEYERYCNIDQRAKMFNRKCYVDYIAQKMNITPKRLLERCYAFEVKYGIDFTAVRHYDRDSWILLSGKERAEYVSRHLRHFLQDETEYQKSEGQLYVAMANTYFNCWLDEEFIHCARCGKIIKNSKQRNRRFCDDCTGYQKRDDDYAFCIDCGEEFQKSANNQYRCPLCQKEADRAAARERAKKYRERKNHVSG